MMWINFGSFQCNLAEIGARGPWRGNCQLAMPGGGVQSRGCRTGPRRMANLCTLPKSRNRGQNYVRPAKGSRQQCNSQTEPRQQIAQKIVEQQQQQETQKEKEGRRGGRWRRQPHWWQTAARDMGESLNNYLLWNTTKSGRQSESERKRKRMERERERRERTAKNTNTI